ncbi:DUF4397 domain-containing protein [Nitriliruptoraceae bacterium ZYF776]|nr:DUF4397 domain-containing protein [Profundirhabdus halotolerans]
MKTRYATAAFAAATLVLAPTAALAQDGEAEVVAVHGIPQSIFDTLGADSTAVDVYVADSYDAPLLTFEFGDVESLNVPAGAYDLEVYAAGSDPASDDAVLELTTPELTGGASASVVAQLNEAGDTPSLEAYLNETDGTGIQVFHTAAFGPVDIVSDGEVVLEGAANGDTARIDIPGGTTVPAVGVAPTGGDVALELGDVEVPADTLVLAYAIGSLDDDTLQVVTATTAAAGDDAADDDGADTDGDDAGTDAGTDEASGDESTPVPTHVDAGTGGLATGGLPAWALGLMLLGAVSLAVPVAARVSARR